MRRIELTTAFRRDFKREKRGQHRGELDSLVRRNPARRRQPSLRGIAIIDWEAIGTTIANAISSRTCS